MTEIENQFSEIASLLGDKARSVMLWSLLDGRAYTATELSVCSNISAQSASNHLAKMVSANLLSVERQGRHRYYKYASAEVAMVIESMASLVPLSQQYEKPLRPQPKNLTDGRTCYDHLAGKLGVGITDSLIKSGIAEVSGKGYVITSFGHQWLDELGVSVSELKLQKRSFAHQCMDWSERKHHMAGALAASLLDVMLKNDWIRRKANSREIIVTHKGKVELKNRLDLDV